MIQGRARQLASSSVVVSMTDQRLLRWDGEATTTHADLAPYCGGLLNHRRFNTLMFADETDAHVACFDRAEDERLMAAAERALHSPDALADEAELLLQGEPLP